MGPNMGGLGIRGSMNRVSLRRAIRCDCSNLPAYPICLPLGVLDSASDLGGWDGICGVGITLITK